MSYSKFIQVTSQFYDLISQIVRSIYLVIFYVVFMVVFSSFQIPAIAVLFPIILCVFVFIALRTKQRKMPFIIIILCLPLIMFVANQLQVSTYTWDYGELLNRAAEYALKGEFSYTNYYAVYPNNKMWLTVLIFIFKIVIFCVKDADEAFLFAFSTYFSAFIVWCVIAVFYKIVEGNLYKCLFFIMCLPLWCYCTFAYTDVATMFMIICLLYIIKTRNSNHKISFYFMIGIMLVFGYLIKPTFFIAYIAITMITCIYIIKYKLYKQLVAFIVAACLSAILLTAICDKIVPVSESEADRWQMPATHYFMMGLNQADNGGYVQEDVIYTESFETQEAKKTANINKLKERISEMGLVGTIKFIFISKLNRTWGNSTLNAPMYLAREPLNDSFLHYFVLETGKYYKWFKLYCWIYHLFMLTGLLLSGFGAIKKTNSDALIVRISRLTLLGLFTFLSIWECNSRYLVAFIPMLVLVSIDGWGKTIMCVRSFYGCNKKSRIF